MTERAMRKFIESLLVISGLLIFLAIFLAIGFAVCGCKSENIPPYPGPNEPTFEFTENSTEPTADRVLWLADDEWPPKLIKVNDGDKTIEYIPKSEPKESEEILICPEHYKRYCKICESIVYRAGWLLPFKGSYLYNQALKEKPEPNEPRIYFKD